MRGMIRVDRKLSQEPAAEVLQKGTWGVLSSVCDDGLPYGIPLNYVADGAYTVYFHGAKSGQKWDNLAYNSRVCLTVVPTVDTDVKQLTTRYESVMAFGTAQIVDDEDERQKALTLLIERFSPALTQAERAVYLQRFADKTAIVKMEIEYISGKANR